MVSRLPHASFSTGTTVQGIFRLSGSYEELQELVMRFDCGMLSLNCIRSFFQPLPGAALCGLHNVARQNVAFAAPGAYDDSAILNSALAVIFLPKLFRLSAF